MTNEPKPIDDGGAAFPHHVYKFEMSMSKHSIFDGMSLRDYFAGQAMQAIVTSCQEWTKNTNAEIASSAYCMADAMIEARKTQAP